MKIRVFGPGCRKCDQTLSLVRKVLTEMGREADIEKVTDYQEIASAGILGTPAISIDGNVVIAGRVPKADELRTWLGG